MRQGKAPFVKNDNGELFQVQLHHATGRENLHNGEVFNSEMNSGTIIEISSETHKDYDKILHIPKGKNESFRVDTLTNNKSEEAKQFEAFRKNYWIKRAQEFENSND